MLNQIRIIQAPLFLFLLATLFCAASFNLAKASSSTPEVFLKGGNTSLLNGQSAEYAALSASKLPNSLMMKYRFTRFYRNGNLDTSIRTSLDRYGSHGVSDLSFFIVELLPNVGYAVVPNRNKVTFDVAAQTDSTTGSQLSVTPISKKYHGNAFPCFEVTESRGKQYSTVVKYSVTKRYASSPQQNRNIANSFHLFRVKEWCVDPEGASSVEFTLLPNGDEYAINPDGKVATATYDQAAPELSIFSQKSSIDEGENASFVIRSTHAISGKITVNIDVKAQGDYLASGQVPSSIEFHSYSIQGTSGIQYFELPTVKDNATESNGSIMITLKAGSGYTVPGTDTHPSSSVVTVRNTSSAVIPKIRILAISEEIEEGWFAVHLNTFSSWNSNASDGSFNSTFYPLAKQNEGNTMIYHIGTEDGSVVDSDITVRLNVTRTGNVIGDADTGNQTVVIRAGERTADHRIELIDDDATEAGGSITVSVESDGQNPPSYTLSSVQGALVAKTSVEDNDKYPILVLSRHKVMENPRPEANLKVAGIEVGDTMQFTIGTTNGEYKEKDTTINLSVRENGFDGPVSRATVTIPKGKSSATYTVSTIDDNDVNEEFGSVAVRVLDDTASRETYYVPQVLQGGLVDNYHSVWIADNDKPTNPYVFEIRSVERVENASSANAPTEITSTNKVEENDSVKVTIATVGNLHVRSPVSVSVQIDQTGSGNSPVPQQAQTVTMAADRSSDHIDFAVPNDSNDNKNVVFGSARFTLKPSQNTSIYRVTGDSDKTSAMVTLFDNDDAFPALPPSDTAASQEAVGLSEQKGSDIALFRFNPLISISAMEDAIHEGNFARFRIVADGPLAVEQIVEVDVSENGDFIYGTPPDGVLLRSGDTEVFLNVRTVDDNEDEENGSITARIVSRIYQYTVSDSEDRATVMVADDDLGRLEFNSNAVRTHAPVVISSAMESTVMASEFRMAPAKMEETGSSFKLGGGESFTEVLEDMEKSVNNGKFNMQNLLGDSSFFMKLSTGDVFDRIWGLGDVREVSHGSSNGSAFTGHAGFDSVFGQGIMAGFSVSYTSARMDYSTLDDAGEYENSMIGTHHHIGWESDDLGTVLWANAGYSSGEIAIARETIDIDKTDTSLGSVAFGGSQVLFSDMDDLNSTGNELRFKGMAWSGRQFIEGNSEFEAMTIGANHVRGVIAAEHQSMLPFESQLQSSAKLGFQWHEGNGVSAGSTLDFSGNVQYTGVHALDARISVGTQIRSFDHFSGNGAEGLFKLDDGRDGLGMVSNLKLGWGHVLAVEDKTIWELLSEKEKHSANAVYFDTEIGYGMNFSTENSVLTPIAGLGFSDSNLDVRLGAEYGFDDRIDLGIDGKQIFSDSGIDRSFRINGSINW